MKKILRLAVLAQDDTEIREHSGKRYPLSVTSVNTGASSPVGGALDASQTLPHLQNPAHGQFVTAMGGRLLKIPELLVWQTVLLLLQISKRLRLIQTVPGQSVSARDDRLT